MGVGGFVYGLFFDTLESGGKFPEILGEFRFEGTSGGL